MKTLIRIQHHSENGFNFKTAQILNKPWKDSNTIEVLGHIKFQQTAGEDNWYGLKFIVETDRPEFLMKMGRLCKFIRNNTDWDSQPDEIFEKIGAVEYKVFNHEFVLASQEGENLYDVFTPSGSLHSRLIAPDDKKARKILDKRNGHGTTFKLNSIIKF